MQAAQRGHVFLAHDDEIELALRITHGSRRDVDEDEAPLLRAAHRLVCGGTGFAGGCDVLPRLIGPVRRHDQVEDRATDGLGGRVAEDRRGSVVPEQNLAGRGDGDQGVG